MTCWEFSRAEHPQNCRLLYASPLEVSVWVFALPTPPRIAVANFLGGHGGKQFNNGSTRTNLHSSRCAFDTAIAIQQHLSASSTHHARRRSTSLPHNVPDTRHSRSAQGPA